MDDKVFYYGKYSYRDESKQWKRVCQVYCDLMRTELCYRLPMLTGVNAGFGFRIGGFHRDRNYVASVVCPRDRPYAYAEVVVIDADTEKFVYFDLEGGDFIKEGDVTVCSNLSELFYFLKRTSWIVSREAGSLNAKLRKEDEKKKKESQLGLAGLKGDERRKQRQKNRKRGKY